VEMEARPDLVLQVVLVIFGGGARWSSMAERFLPCARGPLRPPCASISPRISTRRRLKKMEELVVEQGDAVDGAGWRLPGVEVRRFPVRWEASSDPRSEWRSSGAVPPARPARRRYRFAE
jgi:hypothetical protein